MRTMTKIQRAASRLIKQYGTVRKAAEATGIDYASLHRLKTGVKRNPTEATLRKLGLQKRVIYSEAAP